MASSQEVLSAFKELAQIKQLDRNELRELIRDGIIGAVVALAIGIGLGFLIARRRRSAAPV